MQINSVNTNKSTSNESKISDLLNSASFKDSKTTVGDAVFEKTSYKNRKEALGQYAKNGLVLNCDIKKEDKIDAGKANSYSEDMAESINVINEMITPKGYSQMEELGITPDKDDPTKTIGVYERIQIELATYCEDYNVIGLSIDKEKIEEILGSKAFAASVSKAMSSRNIDDTKKENIIRSGQELTVDNMYKANHSVGANSSIYPKPGAGTEPKVETDAVYIGEKEWKELAPQIEKMLTKSGLEANEKNMEAGKWLISKDLPLTVENIEKVNILNEIASMSDGDFKEYISENICKAMYFTGSAKGALLSTNTFDTSNINKYIKGLDEVTQDEIESLESNNKTINFKNIEAIINKTKKDASTGNNVQEKNEVVSKANEMAYSKGWQAIIEARAVLTASSLTQLKIMGVNIDVTSIYDMVDAIKSSNDEVASSMLQLGRAEVSDKNISTFWGSVNGIYAIESAHVGSVSNMNIDASLKENVDAIALWQKKNNSQYGMNLKGSLEKIPGNNVPNFRFVKAAISTYEAVGTQVRGDLGDSYKKAFANVDTLIEENGLEVNEYNRRAVRILGYNSMEITPENIKDVKEKVAEIDYLVKNLTPKAVSYLIANDIDPMKEDIRSLNERLEAINEEIGADYNEKFSEYLWKLDRRSEISKEDRAKFIKLYRDIYSITKSDTSAVGAAMESGYELNLSNLLKAANSRKVSGYDRKLCLEIISKLDASSAKAIFKNDRGDLSLENIAQIVNENISKDDDDEYIATKLNNIKEMCNGAKDIDKLILAGDREVIGNVTTLYMLNGGNKVFRDIKEEIAGKDSRAYIDLENTLDEIENVLENEKIDEFEEFYRASKAVVNEEVWAENPHYQDINTALFNSEIGKAMLASAKTRSYYIPVELNGETTNIHLTFKSGTDSGMRIFIKESAYGEVSAEFTAEISNLKDETIPDEISDSELDIKFFRADVMGTVKCNILGNVSMLQERLDNISKQVSGIEVKSTTSAYLMCAKLFIGSLSSKDNWKKIR